MIIGLGQLCLMKSSACSKSSRDLNGAQGSSGNGRGCGSRVSDNVLVLTISGGVVHVGDK